MLNKAGETIFWSSISDNLINFVRCFCESYFFQRFYFLYFTSLSTTYLFFVKRNILEKIYNTFSPEYQDQFKRSYLTGQKFLYFLDTFKKNKNFLEYVKLQNPTNVFFSKVFFFQYQGWIMVTVRLYIARRRRLILRGKRKVQTSQHLYETIWLWKYFLYRYLEKKFSKYTLVHKKQF